MDERLREFERRWNASGSEDDEAALVSARLRLGEVSVPQVAVAALVGNSAAKAVLSGDLGDLINSDLLEFVRSLGGGRGGFLMEFPLLLDSCGVETGRRAAVALADCLLQSRPNADLARGVQLVEAWILGGDTDETRKLGAFLRHRLSAERGRTQESRVAAILAELPSQTGYEQPATIEISRKLENGRLASFTILRHTASDQAARTADHVLSIGCQVLSQDVMLEALRIELAPWLLGHGDRLAARATGRDPVRDAPPAVDATEVVYRNPRSHVFHRAGCVHVPSATTTMPLSEAYELRLRACMRCSAPST